MWLLTETPPVENLYYRRSLICDLCLESCWRAPLFLQLNDAMLEKHIHGMSSRAEDATCNPLKTWPDLLCLDVSFLLSLGLVSADWSRNPLTAPPGRCLGRSLRATFHRSSYGERSPNAAELTST